MPIIDFICTNAKCRNTDSEFHPVACGRMRMHEGVLVYSDTLAPVPVLPEASVCSVCSALSLKDFGSYVSIGFPEIVLHINKSTGVYSFPGHKDDPIEAGYERVSINSMRQYAKVCREVEMVEREKAHLNQAIEREHYDNALKVRREERRAFVERAISQGRIEVEYKDEEGITRKKEMVVSPRARMLLDTTQAYVDRKREERYARLSRGTPNFHSRMLEFDSSNQSIVSGHNTANRTPERARGRR